VDAASLPREKEESSILMYAARMPRPRVLPRPHVLPRLLQAPQARKFEIVLHLQHDVYSLFGIIRRAKEKKMMITLTSIEMKALYASKLFDGYSAVGLAVFLEEIGAQRRTFGNNEVLFCEGDPAITMGIVLSGDMYVNGSLVMSDMQIVHKLLSSGDVFGATMVDSTRKSHPVTLIGRGKGSVVMFSLAKIRALQKAGREACFFSNLRSYLSNQLIDCWRKCTILSNPTIAERVLVYLTYRAHETGSNAICISSTREAFANYLGVNRSALSRAISKLMKEGKIACRKNVFTLLNPADAASRQKGALS